MKLVDEKEFEILIIAIIETLERKNKKMLTGRSL